MRGREGRGDEETAPLPNCPERLALGSPVREREICSNFEVSFFQEKLTEVPRQSHHIIMYLTEDLVGVCSEIRTGHLPQSPSPGCRVEMELSHVGEV
jgi:hypothetical protein